MSSILCRVHPVIWLIFVMTHACNCCACRRARQAGKQLEWLTGGHIRAGMHEVSKPRGAIRTHALPCCAWLSLERLQGLIKHMACQQNLYHVMRVPRAQAKA